MGLNYFVITMVVVLPLVLNNVVCDEHEHTSHAKISESEHFEGGTHNPDYDHDAFLGKTHGHDFDGLSEAESKRRLKDLVQQHVDTSKDGIVDNEELEKWIEHQRTSYMWETIDDVIKNEDGDNDGKVSWKEYKDTHFGRWEGDAHIDKELQEKIDKAEHKFKMSDANKDGFLVRDEYVYFRHPEESSNMQDIAVDEVCVKNIFKELDTQIKALSLSILAF